MPGSLFELITATAEQIGFPPDVAIEQMRRESANFRQDVIYGPFVGKDGERGLAQFIPGTWARFGSGSPYNPSDSMQAWSRYTVYLSNLFGNDLVKILRAYNGGEGNVQLGTVSTRAQNYAKEILERAGQTSYQIPDQPIPENSLNSLSIFGLPPVVSILAIAGFAGVLIYSLSQDD